MELQMADRLLIIIRLKHRILVGWMT